MEKTRSARWRQGEVLRSFIIRLGQKVRKIVYDVGGVWNVLVLDKVVAVHTGIFVSRGRSEVLVVEIGFDCRSSSFCGHGRKDLLVAYPLVQQAGASTTWRMEERGDMERVFVGGRVGRVEHGGETRALNNLYTSGQSAPDSFRHLGPIVPSALKQPPRTPLPSLSSCTPPTV